MNKETVRSKEKRSTEWSNNWRFEKLIVNKQYRPSVKYKKKALSKEFAPDSSVSSRTTESKKEIIQDVYILLPFEIGRRLVRDDAVEQAIETKQSLDKLPISTTITTIDDCEITGRQKVKF